MLVNSGAQVTVERVITFDTNAREMRCPIVALAKTPGVPRVLDFAAEWHEGPRANILR